MLTPSTLKIKHYWPMQSQLGLHTGYTVSQKNLKKRITFSFTDVTFYSPASILE